MLAAAAFAALPLQAELEDPSGDSDGPGGYSPPSDSQVSADDFDLRRFVARLDGEDLVLEVTLGASVRAPGTTQRTNSTPVHLTNGIYYQNIDIYIDMDTRPGLGHSSCVPGRRVAFADGRTWERLIVLTPQPAAAGAVIESAMPSAIGAVVLPSPLTVRGRTIIARVPLARLGGQPAESWGWSVQLSGAAWERNFSLMEELKGSSAPDALTLPVSTTADRWAFGGAPTGRAHPQVVDVILPPGVDQHETLSRFSDGLLGFARIPFVYRVAPSPPSPVVASSPLRLAPAQIVVADIADELVSLSGQVSDLRPLMIGQVLATDGTTVARVLVTQVMAVGAVATALDHQEKISRGAVVHFAPPRSAESPSP